MRLSATEMFKAALNGLIFKGARDGESKTAAGSNGTVDGNEARLMLADEAPAEVVSDIGLICA